MGQSPSDKSAPPAAEDGRGGAAKRPRDEAVRIARDAYERSSLSVERIAEQIGWSAATVRRWAASNGWLRLKSGRVAQRAASEARIRKIEEILDNEIAAAQQIISKRKTGGEDDATNKDSEVARRERGARLLTHLVRVNERLNDMKREILNDARDEEMRRERREAETEFNIQTPEEIRAEIKRRLDRILAETDAPSLARKSRRKRA
ncbi:MAG: hypothetical protein Tsb0010_02960 [Parvularculaceae bacterium]